MFPLLAIAAMSMNTVHAGSGGLRLSAEGGWAFIDESYDTGSSWTAGGRLGHGIGDFVSLEIAAHYMQGISQGGSTSNGTTSSHSYELVAPKMEFVFNLVRDSPVIPTFALGAGLTYRDTWGYSDTEDPRVGNPADIDALFNAGIGLNLQIAGPLHLRTDFRYMLSVGGPGESTAYQEDLYSNWFITSGLLLQTEWFARDKDADGIADHKDQCPRKSEDYDSYQDDDGCPDIDNDQDGILDTLDQCMHDPEDFDEFEDQDGCPELDNDNDGSVDTEDRCPNRAEDQDGYRDRDGCPEGDNDGDGIADFNDRCPNHPEDFDGFEDEDGCADEDNDGDRIFDYEDDCPNTPEVMNGIDDKDGCPDEIPPPDPIPEEMKRFTGVIHGIHFKTDSDELKLSSLPLLNEAAKVLNEYPEIRLEVGGHTDSDGSEEYNIELSARRAASVVGYLVGKGVDTSRLEWKGYGETRPIHPNNTEDQKEANRRVEFRILNESTDGEE